MAYRTIFDERNAFDTEKRWGVLAEMEPTDPYDGQMEQGAQGDQAAPVDAGPGASIFNEYRATHGDQVCPGASCVVHGGRISVRELVIPPAQHA